MNKNNLQNKFNFFVEADIKKGTDETGKELVWIDGIASSSSVADSDDETLYPTGFNLQPFLESGLINYNHKGSTDANANIGVPVEAKVINGGKDLYVKCMLWPCPQTTGIVTAYEAFKKYNIDRKIGFSIEGRSTYKDPMNPKRILRADVTGLAITFCPKNKNTLLNIVKGEYDEAFQPLDGEVVDITSLVGEYNNWVERKSEFYGKEASVKEFLENYHEDHQHLLGDLIQAINKSMDTSNTEPCRPESVEHDPKDISNKKNSNFGKLLKKSDIYIQIAKSYPQTSIADQKIIYSLVEKANTKFFKMEGGQITQEALNKAFSLIEEANGIIKGEQVQPIVNTEDIQKSEDAVDHDSEEVKKAVETAKFLMKAGMEKEAGCETLTKGGFSLVVAQASWEKALSEVQGQQNGGTVEALEAPIMKSEEVTALVTEEIKKSIEPVNGSINKVNEAIQKGFEGFNTILKSLQSQNEQLSASNTELQKRLEVIEKSPAGGRKSAPSAAYVDKFQKSNEGEALTGENVFNVKSQEDLNRLTDRLFTEHEKAIEKGKKEDALLLEGTINQIEISKAVPQFAYRKLAELNIKLVTP